MAEVSYRQILDCSGRHRDDCVTVERMSDEEIAMHRETAADFQIQREQQLQEDEDLRLAIANHPDPVLRRMGQRLRLM